jgi:hypothetical protein
MRTKLAIAAFSLAALATPALAESFFIVQDPTSHHCTIVDQKPTTTTTTVVGNGTYTSRTEAETAMKSVQVCTSGAATTTGGSSTTTTTTTR